MMGISRNAGARWVARIYTDIFRGLPAILGILVIGIGLSPWPGRSPGPSNPYPLGIAGPDPDGGGVHRGDLPLRHPECGEGAAGGVPGARVQLRQLHAPGGGASGYPPGAARPGEPVHCAAEGLFAGVHAGSNTKTGTRQQYQDIGRRVAPPGAGQPLRGAPARTRPRGPARPDRGGSGARRRAVGGVADQGPDVRRRRGPLGDPTHPVLAGRRAARPAGAVRPQPAAARAGARGLAAADSRDRPRAEQLAGADQVDRRQPGVAARARRRRPTTGARTWSTASASSPRAPTRSSRFTSAYARLARLPPPAARPVDVGPLVRRVARSRRGCRSRVGAGPEK